MVTPNLLLLVMMLVWACQESQAQDPAACAAFDNCLDCVSGGCNWSMSSCYAFRMMDAPCVSATTSSPEQACATYEANELDNTVCRPITSCSECVQTKMPSDESRTCTWFKGYTDSFNYCASTCMGLVGCEELSCSASTPEPSDSPPTPAKTTTKTDPPTPAQTTKATATTEALPPPTSHGNSTQHLTALLCTMFAFFLVNLHAQRL